MENFKYDSWCYSSVVSQKTCGGNHLKERFYKYRELSGYLLYVFSCIPSNCIHVDFTINCIFIFNFYFICVLLM